MGKINPKSIILLVVFIVIVFFLFNRVEGFASTTCRFLDDKNKTANTCLCTTYATPSSSPVVTKGVCDGCGGPSPFCHQ